MNKSSYTDKEEISFLMLMIAASYLPEESGMTKGGKIALLPEFYEKYEKEGCPDWTKMYGSKIQINKLLKIVFNAIPSKLMDELTKISDLEPEEYFERFFDICKKYENELINYSELVIESLKRKKITVFLSAYVLHQIIVCPALFGVTLGEILQKAKKGDHESIVRLIQIDKSFIGADWALKEIRKAQMKGDFNFFKLLADNIKKDTWDSNGKKTENMAQRIVLILGWHIGLKDLTHSEVHDFLTALGVCKYDATDSLSREIKNLKLRKPDFKIRATSKIEGNKVNKEDKKKKVVKKKTAKRETKRKRA